METRKILLMVVAFVFMRIVPLLGDVEVDLKQASLYIDNEQYSQAQKIYEGIIRDYSGTVHALRAQADLIRANVISGQLDLQAAQASLERLMIDFPGDGKAISEAFLEVALGYMYAEQQAQPQKTIELCQLVLANWPTGGETIWAKTYIVEANIRLGNEIGAQTAYEELLVRFSKHENIPEAVFEIADTYEMMGERQKALEFYEYAMETWPDYDNWENKSDAIFKLMNLALLRLGLGDRNEADAVCYDIISNFSEDDNIAEVTYQLADAYKDLGERSMALALYQYVTGQGTRVEDQIWSYAAQIKSNIISGSDLANKEKEAEWITNYFNDPELARLVFSVAQQYYSEAFAKENEGDKTKAEVYLQRAKALYKTIIEKLPESITKEVFAESHLLAGGICHRLGGHAEALKYYEKLVANWPDFEDAWHAQLMIGKCYEAMKRTGDVSNSESDVRIRDAYGRVVLNYPECPGVQIANKWLYRNR